MLTTWSPLLVNGVNVSTWRLPVTTVPLGALGVIITVIVPVSPGARTSGVYGAVASTACRQRSPELDVTAGSKSCVSASAAALPVTRGAPATGSNGPSSSGIANQKPGPTCGATSSATAKLLASETPS